MGKRMTTRPKERKLSDDELINLANEIKLRECLWDLSNDNHKKLDAIDAAWADVSSVTGLNGAFLNSY